MDYPTQLSLLRTLKLLSAFGYVAAAGAGLWAENVAVRQRLIHGFASPALLATWFSGYLLATHRYIPLTEPWLVGGFALSLIAQVALSLAARRARVTTVTRAAVLVALALTVALMVFRPTWGALS